MESASGEPFVAIKKRTNILCFYLVVIGGRLDPRRDSVLYRFIVSRLLIDLVDDTLFTQYKFVHINQCY